MSGFLGTTTREQVFNALLNLLATQVNPLLVAASAPQPFNTFQRRMILPDKVKTGAAPYLIVWEGLSGETTTYDGPAMPRKREWECYLIIYFFNDGTGPGASILNPMLEAIEAVLRSTVPGQQSQTLGGLVRWCRIQGVTTKETGDTTTNYKGGAMIPVKILMP